MLTAVVGIVETWIHAAASLLGLDAVRVTLHGLLVWTEWNKTSERRTLLAARAEEVGTKICPS